MEFMLGSTYLGEGRCRFSVWAPRAGSVELNVVVPTQRLIPMQSRPGGYFVLESENIEPGARYFYRLEGDSDRPDPASRFQPEGVHGPSEVIDPRFAWSDEHWRGLPLGSYILYELHPGTFSAEGTLAGVISHLDELKQLGITAIELMPVAQFPGTRNWGYDGVYPFAVQDSYGGPQQLKELVDASHARGLAVVLDVVYNHLGPEGNYLGQFGHYFTDRYRTPWGEAVNFDGPHSDHVRRYFIENALQWVRDYHIDALRLDAVHAIFDESARPFLQELAEAVHDEAERLHRRIYVIEESNKNDARHVRPTEIGGWGLDGVWNDDFHHSVHTLLTGEADGYYADFGRFDQLVKCYREGFVYTGEYSRYRGRRHGVSARDVPAQRFVISTQTHDQVGNRLHGDRLTALVSFEQLKVAAGLMLLSPYLPMLFMGEEYGEKAPFLYFVSHGDPDLVEAVRRGRQQEFASFQWQGSIPDPQAEDTFRRSLLNRRLQDEQQHQRLWQFYRELIRMRRTVPALAYSGKENMQVESWNASRAMFVRRWYGQSETACVFHLSDDGGRIEIPLPQGEWTKSIDSAETSWNGPGTAIDDCVESTGVTVCEMPPTSLVLFVRS